ncbi:MAG: hypothetical protein A3J09_00385 [Candidatus Zambryskibacteria bacterium RIFCSPLOWO2_02_FULL_51_21]|uniref:Extracellular solute-binding protein family 1 n=1 Tax=Candidatus Zambryskibacteria bacterium RIFCSPHIGHO2_02_FULL_43_37 TaxID=1802749 RepID=A0A1G2THY7_9BACT|nr:MAG: hypothetical protein A2723_00385 [Candidatus Zambryskibacteria bacterium RIFCSPHIGHO2_01_FULL_52_18]OHA96910.1 MAG: hypothetical protein A3D49_02285 [Candidatus Zambryskibacteria bacterium RIFCSPHIGHO2_02_FULL_43_37]OHB11023.1 MAG: hypothetical protein A3J09_00385 [Candidatus Zambryskibacteria bacterium RIFCSPLOWO2_02_FULL_51_21]
MSKFQIILLSVFGAFILLAVLIFALYRGGAGSQNATIVVWGDIPSEAITPVLDSVVPTIDKTLVIRYVEKSSDKIDAEFTEALAQGNGPDLLILTQDRFLKNKSKLIFIPYDSIGRSDFQQAFAEEGELFLTDQGVYGLPLAIDPVILYYNRDLLSSAGEAKPISYWDELYPMTLKLTKKDAAGNLTQSAIALGETRNIPNFKEIMSLLLMQAGTPVTQIINGSLRSALSETFGLPVAPGDSALDFYTQFSNPAKAYYSWNRVLPSAETHFASGDSAYYLGFASELTSLRKKNPNLNLGLAPVPQSRVSGKKLTYGRLYVVSITRGARSAAPALRAVLLLSSKPVAEQLAKNLGLPPARRDLLSVRQTDAILPVFYESALQSKGWLDPENVTTRNIFQAMIDSVTSGRARTSEALGAASRSLGNLIK